MEESMPCQGEDRAFHGAGRFGGKTKETPMKFAAFLAFVLALSQGAAQSPPTTQAPPSDTLYTSITELIRRGTETGKRDTKAADSIFKQALTLALKAHDHYLAGKVFYAKGEMYDLHKNHNRAFGAFFNAREHFNLTQAEKEKAYTLFAMGKQQYFRGNYKTSADKLNYAMRAAETLKLPRLRADVLEYLGMLYHVMPGASDKAIPDLKKALTIKQWLQDTLGSLRIMEKLGESYDQQGRYDSSLQYYDMAIATEGQEGLRYDAILSRLSRVGVYIARHQMEKAGQELAQITGQISDTADLNIMIRYYIQQGNYLTTEGAVQEGALRYDSALRTAERISVPELFGMIYKNMARTYGRNSMYKKAYQSMEAYDEQMERYYPENMHTVGDLEYILNSQFTRDELKYLHVRDQLREQELRDEKTKLLLLIIGAMVFLALAGGIFYLYRNQRVKNAIIKGQAEELQTMMKEVDHRVKNNLQFISSLLDLQAITIGDTEASVALKESRNRVNSMSLIHQSLYGQHGRKGIAVEAYINHLARSLFNSYNIHPGQVELTADIEKMVLDVDTVVPIGLILNELISNSLKYAFKGKEGGKIHVELKRCNGLLFLQVRDNGGGFSQAVDAAHGSSFGMRLIRAFAQKMKADLEICNDNGACVVMKIRKYKVAEQNAAIYE